jgi:cell division septation protein DedD
LFYLSLNFCKLIHRNQNQTMEKYLIELLETNNRVIVPDLGAFIIRQQEPRELVFNDLLAFNDGMLTAHIKQVEGISMSKAQVKIEEFVDQVKQVLTRGDIYYLEHLGYLKMDDSSKIEFSLTKFPSARAAVVSSATLNQQGKEETGEIQAPLEEETVEEEAPAPELPEEEAPETEIPDEEGPFSELPEETPAEDSTSAETLEEIPEEDVPDQEPGSAGEVEWEPEAGNIAQDAEQPEEFEMAGGRDYPTEGDLREGASGLNSEDSSFTLDEQDEETDEDESDGKPLIPEPEEPPFFMDAQEKQEEKRTTVVGTSQARLEAAAEAVAEDEKNGLDTEREPVSEPETSIPPYYIERERSIRNVWPWIGGGAALIIILVVAAWFFFPDGFNRIFGGKSAEQANYEEMISGESSTPAQDRTVEGREQAVSEEESGSEPTAVETGAANQEAAESNAGEATESQPAETTEEIPAETVTETEAEAEPERVDPPATQGRKFYIVAGMFASQQNAENYAGTLKAQGYDSEVFGRKDDLYAVSFSSHVSRAAALEDLARIRKEGNTKAWLLYY